MSKLYFRYGAMNCGKTTALLQSVHNYESRGMRVLVLKPLVDTKGNKNITSRIGLEREVDHLIKNNENLYDYLSKNIEDISCIFVDEAQFLNPKQVDQLLLIVVDYDIPIICYGLRTDFNGVAFPGSPRLLEVAHTIEELKTVCYCGNKATFNARLVNGKFTFDGDQLAIDGEDNVTYESLCAKCYFDKKRKYLKLKNNLKKDS